MASVHATEFKDTVAVNLGIVVFSEKNSLARMTKTESCWHSTTAAAFVLVSVVNMLCVGLGVKGLRTGSVLIAPTEQLCN